MWVWREENEETGTQECEVESFDPSVEKKELGGRAHIPGLIPLSYRQQESVQQAHLVLIPFVYEACFFL